MCCYVSFTFGTQLCFVDFGSVAFVHQRNTQKLLSRSIFERIEVSRDYEKVYNVRLLILM